MYQGKIDLLITEMTMRDSSGVTLWEQVIEKRPEIKVLLISGNAADEAERRGLPFLCKPIDPVAVQERVRQLLAAPA
jgi:DNA-binding NtrC family response regulator